MKNSRKAKKRRKTKKKLATINKRLRAGSKEAKEQLLEQNPCCDICGTKGDVDTLQLHHIYCIRWGFATNVTRCVLLCPNCHYKLHYRYDSYLDELFEENPDTDFILIYEEIKKEMQEDNRIGAT